MITEGMSVRISVLQENQHRTMCLEIESRLASSAELSLMFCLYDVIMTSPLVFRLLSLYSHVASLEGVDDDDKSDWCKRTAAASRRSE